MLTPVFHHFRLLIATGTLGLFTLALPGGDYTPLQNHPALAAPLQQKINDFAISIERRGHKADFAEANELLSSVHRASDSHAEIRVRRLIGGTQIASGHYRDALKTLLPARALATKERDFGELYRITNNVAWIYLEMNNLESAGQMADEAIEANRAFGKYDPAPVILRGFVFAKSGDVKSAEDLFLSTVSRALDSGSLDRAASAWHFLGASYLESHQLQKAEAAETEAFRLRKLHHLPGLEESLRDLARVLGQEGNIRSATVLMDEAIAAMGDPKSNAPVWFFLQARGELRAKKGDWKHALPDLRAALELARRLDVVPTDDDRVTFESGLAELYSLFIDVGNRLYLQTQDPALKQEIFEAAEENRAASLRAIVPQPHDWRTRLPAQHAEVLAQLQKAERQVLTEQTAEANAKVRLLRASLDQIESQAGAAAESGNESALTRARAALTSDSALLAFHLGPESSWIWAVTKTRFEVYALPPKSELADAVAQFTGRVQHNQPSRELGGTLADKLFSVLPEDVHGKHRWILALDQDLFELPLGALSWRGKYLADQHSLLVTPSVKLMDISSDRQEIRGSLIGMGDPIYNLADPRWHNSHPWLNAHKLPGSYNLARLTGSGSEVRAALNAWGQGSAFTGTEVSTSNLEQALNTSPAILHLATHVIKAPGRDRSGLIVLSLNSHSEPDLLSMREILLHPAHVRLVVMSGCASGDAIAMPASGLMGLTRAWIGAGAGEILATRWPALDDNGSFFRSFYKNLKNNPQFGAAEALHLTQQEMIHSNSFRSNPEYWASYFLVGKA